MLYRHLELIDEKALAGADPFTGVEIVFTPDGIPGDPKGIEVIGGTSLACPMFSARWAIANQASGTALGQAAPVLYALPPDTIPIQGIVTIHGGDHVMTIPIRTEMTADH